MTFAGLVILALLWPDWCIGYAVGVATYHSLKGRL